MPTAMQEKGLFDLFISVSTPSQAENLKMGRIPKNLLTSQKSLDKSPEVFALD
jgi:hypothetical protein